MNKALLSILISLAAFLALFMVGVIFKSIQWFVELCTSEPERTAKAHHTVKIHPQVGIKSLFYHSKAQGGLGLQKEICNHCGKELDLFDLQQEFIIHTRINYGSIHDGDNVHCRLCNDCFDKIVAECKVSPIIQNTGGHHVKL